jgi:hypothetical protein
MTYLTGHVIFGDAGFVRAPVREVEDSIAVVVGIGTAVVGLEVVMVLGGFDAAVDEVWHAVEISVRLARSCRTFQVQGRATIDIDARAWFRLRRDAGDEERGRQAEAHVSFASPGDRHALVRPVVSSRCLRLVLSGPRTRIVGRSYSRSSGTKITRVLGTLASPDQAARSTAASSTSVTEPWNRSRSRAAQRRTSSRGHPRGLLFARRGASA